jgi:hypothetical protein
VKLIFLDFDGVLNSHKFLHSDYFNESIKGLIDAELYLLKYEYMLDPEAIKLVNDLVNRSGAYVVASTSHRLRYSLEELNKMLAGRGATFVFIGKTPKVLPEKFSATVDRGEEIQAFLDGLPEPPESFVILDDLNNMAHLSDHLVLTSDRSGIRDIHVEDALKILNGETK